MHAVVIADTQITRHSAHENEALPVRASRGVARPVLPQAVSRQANLPRSVLRKRAAVPLVHISRSIAE